MASFGARAGETPWTARQHLLFVKLKRSRRAMLWAIAEKRELDSMRHARLSARYGGLLLEGNLKPDRLT